LQCETAKPKDLYLIATILDVTAKDLLKEKQ